jgi:glucose-6-phosphate 1-epimerase
MYSHGAHLTSWTPSGGSEQLFLSRTSDFGSNASIRGGVPIIFPQFAGEGPLPKHGFARRMEWEQVNLDRSVDTPSVTFRLLDSPATRAIWPHLFEANFTVSFGGPSLEMTLVITNPGPLPFTFTAALHTYLRVADVHVVSIHGLQGITYIDSAADRAMRTEESPLLTFSAETDRIYVNPPAHLLLQEPGRTLQIATSGFPDTVVWNPWAERGAALTDLEPDGYLRMVCIEAALVSSPVTLPPGEAWTGSQYLIA